MAKQIWKWFAGLAVVGAALGWSFFSVLMVLQGQSRPEPITEIWPTLFVFCVTIHVLYTRGNVAKLLPRVKWLY